jgi:hypothetical protein
MAVVGISNVEEEETKGMDEVEEMDEAGEGVSRNGEEEEEEEADEEDVSRGEEETEVEDRKIVMYPTTESKSWGSHRQRR